MTLEKAWFILEHGSSEGLPVFLEAIDVIKENYIKVIRCKDCAYALFKEGVEPGHIVCTKPFSDHWQSVKPDDWFCADGYRKDS